MHINSVSHSQSEVEILKTCAAAVDAASLKVFLHLFCKWIEWNRLLSQ
jgi:hypothetical protein